MVGHERTAEEPRDHVRRTDRTAVYALYRGEDFVDVGTANELAGRRGVKAASIRWLASPASQRRDRGQRLLAFRVEEQIA